MHKLNHSDINEPKHLIISFNLTKDIEGEFPPEYEIYKTSMQEKTMGSKTSCF